MFTLDRGQWYGATALLDRDAPSTLRALAEYRKTAVQENLVKLAMWRTQSLQDAEDLIANALFRTCDPDDAPWEKGTFLSHMHYLMRYDWDAQMHRACAQREILDGGFTANERAMTKDPRQDDELHRLRTVDLWRSIVEKVLPVVEIKHPLTRKVYDLAARGIQDPADQARELHCDVDEIERARKIIEYHARLAKDEWDVAERRRMKDLQEAEAKKKSEKEKP